MLAVAVAALLSQTAPPAEGAQTGVEPTAMVAPPRPLFENVNFDGFIKVGYLLMDGASGDELIGTRNGFRLFNVRLGFGVGLAENAEAYASVDAANPMRSSTDPLSGSLGVSMRDGFVRWKPASYAHLRVGQFRPPYNAEALLGDEALPFVERSVMSNGLLPPIGFTQRGLSPNRQLGVEWASARLEAGALGIYYAVALTNGTDENELYNDNSGLSPVARLQLDWDKVVTLGVNGYYNARTEGARPNRLTQLQTAWGGDLGVKVGGFRALAVVLGRRSVVQGVDASLVPPENALGVMGMLHYLHQASGFEGGVRYSQLEPSSVVPTDQMAEWNFLLGYRLQSIPVRVVAEYSLRTEERGVSVRNNGLDLMAQVTW